MTRTLSDQELDRARRDPVVFADLVLGEPLWPHQEAVVSSQARYRILNAGRRAGKTRVFGVLILWLMFSRPGARVLMVSAGRTSVVRSHREVAAMAIRSVGGSSVEGDQVMTLTLSNDSTLESVTQSVNAVRSADVDLLVIDEAGFVEQLVWESAEPTIGARPGARVLIASSPWRGPGHFFHDLWRQGMARPDAEVASWHWPSTASPLVAANSAWLEGVRERSAPDVFAREYLAEWTDEAGAYFTSEEIDAVTGDYEIQSPADIAAHGRDRRMWPAVAGLDWGMRKDANAAVLLAPLEDGGANAEVFGPGGRALYVPWLVARYGWHYEQFIDYLVDTARAYGLEVIVSEMNGPGDFPTTTLRSRLHEAGLTPPWVAGVWTSARSKATAFATLKVLMQSRRIVLPRHPELLSQLRGLEFEQTESGNLRISVPDRIGHDDLALALCQAIAALRPDALRGQSAGPRRVGEFASTLPSLRDRDAGSVTAGGVWVPASPRPAYGAGHWFKMPAKTAKSEQAW